MMLPACEMGFDCSVKSEPFLILEGAVDLRGI